jgi:hypothetical protein
MGITLESIYKPVNEFFVNTFKSSKDAPVAFRLQNFAHVINEEDFEGITNPEVSSDLVNEIPYVDDNGLNVGFLSNTIDSAYELILGALPFIDDSLSEDENEAIHNSVMRTKAQVDRDWESFSQVRGNGITDFFRLTHLSPSNWFESESKVWEKRNFEIKEPISTVESTKSKSKSNLKILKVRMTDAQLINALPLLNVSKKVKPIELKMQVLKMQPVFFGNPLVLNTVSKPKPKPTKIIRDHRKLQKAVFSRKMNVTLKPIPNKASKVKRTAVGLKFSKAFHGLRFNEKILVKDFIKKKSPSKAIKTNNVSISFEYCVVKIRRQWFNEVMCNINRSWYIPGIKKGAISDPEIGTLSHLPVAFLAVRNLNITANWDSLDKKELEKAVSFGPFDINNQDIKEKGSLSHDGIQIIGWMLQELPELPPNGKD